MHFYRGKDALCRRGRWRPWSRVLRPAEGAWSERRAESRMRSTPVVLHRIWRLRRAIAIAEATAEVPELLDRLLNEDEGIGGIGIDELLKQDRLRA